MPGRPIWRKFLRDIEAAGGDEYMFDRIAAGEGLTAIGRTFGVGRRLVYKYTQQDQNKRDQYQAAKILASGALVEDAMEILDKAQGEDSASVQAANNRARFRTWWAERLDRKEFGPAPAAAAATLQISIGELHLDALRARGGPGAQRTIESGEIVEAEVVEIKEPSLAYLVGAAEDA